MLDIAGNKFSPVRVGKQAGYCPKKERQRDIFSRVGLL